MVNVGQFRIKVCITRVTGKLADLGISNIKQEEKEKVFFS